MEQPYWKCPKVHKSHRMSKWENTIVTIIDTSRFGRWRNCKKCGGEQAETVAGHSSYPELLKPCHS